MTPATEEVHVPKDIVYSITPTGEKELRAGSTTLSPLEIELLIRVDGRLTCEQIQASMPTGNPYLFTAAFRRLENDGFLRVEQPDPFSDQFQVELDKMALSLFGTEAATGAASLKESGYYVNIARAQAPVRERKPGTPLSAVVVEDDPLLAKFVASYLTLEGFQVRRAGNRNEVVAEMRKRPVPDLVLLDVMLPDADGFDILLRMRQHPDLKAVPVIMLTGKTSREDVLKGLAGGANGYITKPFEPDALLRAVRTVVGLPVDSAAHAGDPWMDRDE